MRDVVIHVCKTCKREEDAGAEPRAGQRLLDGILAAAPVSVRIVPVECLSSCKRACTVSIAAAGAWTYVFGDLDPHLHAEDVLAAAAVMADDPDGTVPWRRRPEPLRRGTVARIPPLPQFKDAAE